MSILPVSPPSTPTDYSAIFLKVDPPPAYPSDEDPPSYFSIYPEAVEVVVVWDENRARCCNLRRCRCSFSCSHLCCCPSCWKMAKAPLLVSSFDIILNLLALTFFIYIFRLTGTLTKRGDAEITLFFYVPWMCFVVFHTWWLFASCKLLRSADPGLPRNERRQLTITWKKMNMCLVGLFWCPLAGILLLVVVTAWSEQSDMVTGIKIFSTACIPFAVRLMFYFWVKSFTKTL